MLGPILVDNNHMNIFHMKFCYNCTRVLNGQRALGICLGSNAERLENHGLESGQVEEDSGWKKNCWCREVHLEFMVIH